MRDMFDDYVRTRTLHNWKFWVVSTLESVAWGQQGKLGEHCGQSSCAQECNLETYPDPVSNNKKDWGYSSVQRPWVQFPGLENTKPWNPLSYLAQVLDWNGLGSSSVYQIGSRQAGDAEPQSWSGGRGAEIAGSSQLKITQCQALPLPDWAEVRGPHEVVDTIWMQAAP